MDENNNSNNRMDNDQYTPADYSQDTSQRYGQSNAQQGYGQDTSQNYNQSYNNQGYSSQNYGSDYGAPRMTPEEAPMTMTEWLVTLIVAAIPCINIIMLFVWAFGSTGNVNRRNFCRAQLIIMAAGIVLAMFSWGILGSVLYSVIGSGY